MRSAMRVMSVLISVAVLGFGCVVLAQPDQAVIGVRGNWIKKNAWMKEAQAMQKQLLEDSGVVKKSRTQFSDEFDRIDKKVNTFYSSKGFERGKIGSLIEDIKTDIAADKARRIAHARKRSESDDAPINFYDVHVEAIEQEVKRFERDFEQFNLDMKSIADLDTSLGERLKIVDKQIKDAADVVTQSSKKLDEMWWIIDDQKAADAFYAIQDFADKMSAIKKYLNETLFADFKKVSQTLEKQIDQVNKQAAAIEERGFAVSHRAQRMEKPEKTDQAPEAVTADESTSSDADQQEPPVRRRKRTPKPQTWFEQLSDAVTNAFHFFLSLCGLSRKA